MTREEQKEAKRKAILMTALTLFVEKGYHETKVTDIAAAVPMSTGLMFHYFKSKEELLMALVVMGKDFTKATGGGDGVPADLFLKGMLSQLFSYAKKEPFVANMFVLMAQARRAGMPEEVRKVALSVEAVDNTAKIIEKGQKDGLFREGDPGLLARCFWSAFQGIMEEMTIDKELDTPDPEWLMGILYS
ncbi:MULTISPECIES: TetR/AcrR family transcriptional regulator [unclassified Butyrivibrio]|uniref:TetR/AcrR family transcriptional regulator n=1 Tax=unclassified Butyrivibrio TaxID=2639466 RepID=UPI00047EB885|nr:MULTISPECIES: TetR/AcrR family transcriptional regulator [unclassified Butyrivibrio]MDC7292707.1 TetR/AcrR family transcriptional regulator [Butyrivibrio sp. DSM 10294]